MSPASNNTSSSEGIIISTIIANPKLLFEIDNVILRESDFSQTSTRCIYSAVKNIIESHSGSMAMPIIDEVLLTERVSALFPTAYESEAPVFAANIRAVIKRGGSTANIMEHAKIVVKASVRRQASRFVESLTDYIESDTSPKSLLSGLEQKVMEFTSSIFNFEDISLISKDFDAWMQKRQEEAAAGKELVGIKSGYGLYDQSIGGGLRRKTVNVVAARAKMGKSFLGLNIAYNVAKMGTPVLLLDTELDRPTQDTRLLSIMTELPLRSIETADFRCDPVQTAKIKEAMQIMKSLPIYYVDIKGWGIVEQLSVIRRWFTKVVGKKNGVFNDGLVILDYLKLMNQSDKGFDQKEYETLGYRMTAFHDLMGEVDNPMFMLVQQNRDGLEKDDESTVSGSDRITWFCDNLSIFRNKSDLESKAMEERSQEDPLYQVTNMKLIVTNSRHGPGTPGGYIAMYAGIKDSIQKAETRNGRIKEVRMELSYDGDSHDRSKSSREN